MLQKRLCDLRFDCFENVRIRSYRDCLELPEILTGIGYHDVLENWVEVIRESKFKKEDLLPVFIPSLTNGKPNGIVQLDYDEIKDIENSERLKRELESKVPYLLYAFISPKGGLKAGILTDFHGEDVEPEKFKYTVEIVEDDVRRLLGKPDLTFDHHSKTINQPCFFSYDENLVYNPTPVELPVKEKAEALFLEQQKREKERVESIRYVHVVPDDEIKSAFLSIPPDLHDKDRRNKLNIAVLNVFGEAGVDLILNHWYFPDHPKAQESIQRLYQKTLQHQGSRVGTKTIIEEAKKHGWKNTTQKGRKSTGLEGYEPTYSGKIYPNVAEAVEVSKTIIGNFFKTGLDTLLHAECGLGKTQQTLIKIAEIDDSVAYFIPEHETANEIETKLLQLGVPADDVQIIKGYSRSCRKIAHLKDDEKVGLYQNWKTCLSCQHYHEDCDYHEQFKGNERIRIYPHAYLYSPATSDRFKPDFVVVDESITENVCDIIHYKRNHGSIFKRLIDHENVTVQEIESEIDRLRKLFKALENDNQLLPPPAYEFDSDEWKDKLKRNKQLWSNRSKIKHLEELKKKKEGKYTEYKIWKRSGRIWFGRKKRIDPRWHSRPILHLDASGDRKITEIVFEKDFKVYEKIRCQYAPGVRVIQIFDKLFSKNQCSEETTRKDLEWLVSMLDGSEGLGFIGYKQIEKIPFISKLIPKKWHDFLLWYGALRGKNKIEDAGCSSLMCIGSYNLSNDSLINIAHVLFNETDFVEDICTVEKTYRMADGNHLTGIFVEYADERLQVLSEAINRAETYQAGHRLRLLHEPDRTLFLLTNEVLDYTVDELIALEQIIPSHDKKRKLIEAVKANDGLIPVKGNNKIIMKKTGLLEEQVKNLKKDNKEWMKENFWFYADENGMLRFAPGFREDQ